MRILFLVPYPEGEAPSQRFRFEQYLPILEEKGHQITVKPFLDRETWKILYKEGHTAKKVIGIFKGFLRRTKVLSELQRYDRVFIHREASPVGPPLFEWLIARVWKKPLIFDFDDAIWLPNTSSQNSLAASFKYHQKTAAICKWSHTISCGNAFLADYAKKNTAEGRVVINPTTIDTRHHSSRKKAQTAAPLVIGWTGTHSTIKYLKPLEEVLKVIVHKYPEVIIRIISNQAPGLDVDRLEYLPWNKSTEITDLSSLHIGLMPLTEDIWSAGKCGFKALQYMALGIPPIVSPVGVNTSIVEHGVSGFIAQTPAEWLHCIETLINNPELRKSLGNKSRQAVTERFSVEANTATFLRLFSLEG